MPYHRFKEQDTQTLSFGYTIPDFQPVVSEDTDYVIPPLKSSRRPRKQLRATPKQYQRNEMGSFGEAVHHCEDDGVAIRGRKAGDEVHGNMGPRAMRYGKWLKKTRGRLPWCLVLIAHNTGSCEGRDVCSHSGPPEPATNESQGTAGTRMTGQV